jgi:exosome complex RNA-binding protein Rrp42 (RNase PH superfamily)
MPLVEIHGSGETYNLELAEMTIVDTWVMFIDVLAIYQAENIFDITCIIGTSWNLSVHYAK